MKVKTKRSLTVGGETIDPGRMLTDEQVKQINPRNLKAMESTGHVEVYKEMGSEEFDKLQAENDELKEYIKELENELVGKNDVEKNKKYSEMDADELKALCKERDISLQGFGTAKSSKLVELLEKNDEERDN